MSVRRIRRSKHVIVWTRTGFKAHVAAAGTGRTACGARYTLGDTVASAKDLFLVGLCENCRTQLLDAEARRRDIPLRLAV